MLNLMILFVLQGCASDADVQGLKKEVADLKTKVEEIEKKVSKLGEKTGDDETSQAFGMEDGPWQIKVLQLTGNKWGENGVSFGGVVVDDDPTGGSGADATDHNWYEFFDANFKGMDKGTGWAISVGGTGPNCVDKSPCLKLQVQADWGIGDGHALNKDIDNYKYKITTTKYHEPGWYAIYGSLVDLNTPKNVIGYMEIVDNGSGKYTDNFYGNLPLPKKNTTSWYVIKTDKPDSVPEQKKSDNVEIKTN
jgi:hypothetical protein